MRLVVKTVRKFAHRKAAERRRDLRAAVGAFGRAYQRRIVREFLSGRPGLNRVTGAAARGWAQVVIPEGNGFRLIVWTAVRYVQFHADDYIPRGTPRRFPVRVRAGGVWRDMVASPSLRRDLERSGGVIR